MVKGENYMEIGAQLFTLRDFCKNLDDFSETLKKVADMGYKNVQVSGVCDYQPEWLKEQLDKNGLKCVLTHIPSDRLIGDTDKVIADHNIFSCKNVGLGMFVFNSEKEGQTYDDFVNTYMPVAKKLKSGDKYFMYHNHDRDFGKIDNKPIMLKLAEDFSPDILGFTLDVFWIQMAGGDPAYWIEKFSGRIPCIHLKDFCFAEEDRKSLHMAPLGEGNLNFDRIFASAEKAGTEYMLVEQDNCKGEDPFECMKKSYDYLRSYGFR